WKETLRLVEFARTRTATSSVGAHAPDRFRQRVRRGGSEADAGADEQRPIAGNLDSLGALRVEARKVGEDERILRLRVEPQRGVLAQARHQRAGHVVAQRDVPN